MSNAQQIMPFIGPEPRTCRDISKASGLPIRSVRYALRSLEREGVAKKVELKNRVRPTARWALAAAILLAISGCIAPPASNSASPQEQARQASVAASSNATSDTPVATLPVIEPFTLESSAVGSSQVCELSLADESTLPFNGSIDIPCALTSDMAVAKTKVDLGWSVQGAGQADYCVVATLSFGEQVWANGSNCEAEFMDNQQHMEASLPTADGHVGDSFALHVTAQSGTDISAAILVGPSHPFRITLEAAA